MSVCTTYTYQLRMNIIIRYPTFWKVGMTWMGYDLTSWWPISIIFICFLIYFGNILFCIALLLYRIIYLMDILDIYYDVIWISYEKDDECRKVLLKIVKNLYEILIINSILWIWINNGIEMKLLKGSIRFNFASKNIIDTNINTYLFRSWHTDKEQNFINLQRS